MSGGPTAADWLELLAVLGLGGAAVVGVAALAERAIRSAAWRRTLWQTATITLLLILAAELTGAATLLSHGAPRLVARLTESFRAQEHAVRPSNDIPAGPAHHEEAQSSRHAPRDALPESADLSVIPFERLEPQSDEHNSSHAADAAWTAESSAELPLTNLFVSAPTLSAATATTTTNKPNRPVTSYWWLGVVWTAGTVLAAAWFVAARVLLARCRRRRFTRADAPLCDRVTDLARRLGMRRRVSVVESRSLAGPIAFGVLRPTVALPAGFAEEHDAVQQDAILAHELAHLAAADPAWYVLSDAAAAALWWHPLVWWSRARLRACSELAADEASQLVADGPRVLAACLVALGDRLTRRPAAGWARMAGSGFRSGLGRRVERLMQLDGTRWSRPRRLLRWPATLFGVLLFSAIVAGGTTWARHNSFETGESTMNPMHSAWRKSLAGMLVIGALGWNQSPHLPAQDAGDAAAPAITDQLSTDDEARAQDVASQASGVEAERDVGDRSRSERATAEDTKDQVTVTITIAGDPAEARDQVMQIIELLRQTESTKSVRVFLRSADEEQDASQSAEQPARPAERLTQKESNQLGPSPQEDAKPTIRVFRLEHRDPEEVTTIIGSLLQPPPPANDRGLAIVAIAPDPNQPRIVVDQRTRSLLVRGTKAQLQAVAAFVEILDVADGQPAAQSDGLRVFQLRHAQAQAVADVLRNLGIQLRIVADAKLNRLLIAGTPEQIAEVEAVIKQLDVESPKAPDANGVSAAGAQTGRFMVGAGIDSNNSVIGDIVVDDRNFDAFFRSSPLTIVVSSSGHASIGTSVVEPNQIGKAIQGANAVRILADPAASFGDVQAVVDACKKAGATVVRVEMGRRRQPPAESAPRGR